MQNPIPLTEMLRYSGEVYIEFRVFQNANRHMGIYDAMLWAERVFKYYFVKTIPRYGRDWRIWKERPTDKDRAAAAWEKST